MLREIFLQHRKTATSLHDSGVFLSEVWWFMCRGWGSSAIRHVSLPDSLHSSVVWDGSDERSAGLSTRLVCA